jgi:hypothetical protein
MNGAYSPQISPDLILESGVSQMKGRLLSKLFLESLSNYVVSKSLVRAKSNPGQRTIESLPVLTVTFLLLTSLAYSQKKVQLDGPSDIS